MAEVNIEESLKFTASPYKRLWIHLQTLRVENNVLRLYMIKGEYIYYCIIN